MLIISVQLVLVMGRLGSEDRLTAAVPKTRRPGMRALQHALSRDVVSRSDAIQI